MPQYHFQIDDGAKRDDWVDLPDILAARTLASRLAADLIGDDDALLWREGLCELTVLDEGGLLLFRITILWTDAPAAENLLRG